MHGRTSGAQATINRPRCYVLQIKSLITQNPHRKMKHNLGETGRRDIVSRKEDMSDVFPVGVDPAVQEEGRDEGSRVEERGV